MLYQILSLLLNLAVDLVSGSCLLRLYMQWQRVSMTFQSGNPLAPFIFTFSNWCVLPLRRVLPAWGRFDTSSFVAAYLVVLLKLVLLSAISFLPLNWPWMGFWAFMELLHLCLSGLMWLVIVYVLLSWVRTGSDVAYFLARLVEPLLHPLRRVLPQPNGLDLSPIALIVLLQVTEIVLNGLFNTLFKTL